MGNGELWKHERLPMDQTAAENHISKSVLSAGGVSVTSPRPATCSRGSQDHTRQRSNTQPKHDPEHLPAASGFQPLLDLTSHLDPDFLMSQYPTLMAHTVPVLSHHAVGLRTQSPNLTWNPLKIVIKQLIL